MVRVAMSQNDTYKNTDTVLLQGQLLYAVSAEDEVAPAKVLDNFAKANPALQFVGAFGMEGELIDAAGVEALASLPSKNELIGQVIQHAAITSQRRYKRAVWQPARTIGRCRIKGNSLTFRNLLNY